MKNHYSFWEERFLMDGKVWGKDPSPTALDALKFFRDSRAGKILVPGCAYGRHCLLFAGEGMSVTGFDIAFSALQIAHDWLSAEAMTAALIQADARRLPFAPASFEGAYLFNFLHFFLKEDRTRMMSELRRVLIPGAPVVISVFSDSDSAYGKGEEVEPGTFDARGGRPAHFFTETDLREQFADLHIELFNRVDEHESHGGREHVHRLWSVWALTPV